MLTLLDLETYELYPRNEKVLNNYIDEHYVVHYTYDEGSLKFNNIYVYLC